MITSRWTTSWTGIAMLVVAILSAAAGYGWAVRVARHDTTNHVAAAVSPGERKVLYWSDPMRPELRFEKPGKSPFMDMALVPVYADGVATAGGVTVRAEAQQNLAFRLGTVELAAIAAHVSAPGSVGYDERTAVVLQTRVAGYVTHLYVRAALEHVHRGQALAKIGAPAWSEAAGEYLALLGSGPASSAALLAAARQRLVVLGVAESAILKLEQSRSLPAMTLVAPVDGVVTEVMVREGATFDAGTVLFRLNGTATVWVDARVPESLAHAVAKGANAEVRAQALPGETLHGSVLAILPQVDPVTRTLGARIVVDNPAGRLKPGMFVQTTISEPRAVAQLWVPSEAVIATGERTVVIVKRGDGAFEVVPVTLGAEAGGKSAIVSGLSAGQTIVLSGQFLIDSEASLSSTVNRLGGQQQGRADLTP
ncbi:MAG: efflux RND transporter periplasmic adaptor subunit [Steroidobacteraceae bacterium]